MAFSIAIFLPDARSYAQKENNNNTIGLLHIIAGMKLSGYKKRANKRPMIQSNRHLAAYFHIKNYYVHSEQMNRNDNQTNAQQVQGWQH